MAHSNTIANLAIYFLTAHHGSMLRNNDVGGNRANFERIARDELDSLAEDHPQSSTIQTLRAQLDDGRVLDETQVWSIINLARRSVSAFEAVKPAKTPTATTTQRTKGSGIHGTIEQFAMLAFAPVSIRLPDDRVVKMVPSSTNEGVSPGVTQHFFLFDEPGEMIGSMDVVRDATGVVRIDVHDIDGKYLDDLAPAISKHFGEIPEDAVNVSSDPTSDGLALLHQLNRDRASTLPASLFRGGLVAANSNGRHSLQLAPAEDDSKVSAATTGGKPAVDLKKLFIDVFNPQPGETVIFAIDVPHGEIKDNEAWEARRQMAAEWEQVFKELGEERGFTVAPMLVYNASGKNNGPLPEMGLADGEPVNIADLMDTVNLVLVMTEFSGTKPFDVFTRLDENTYKTTLRVGSMPGISPAMMNTAIAADYTEVHRMVHVLSERYSRAEGARVRFSTGDEMYFDLRFREPESDDGQLHHDREDWRLINFPSGESCMAPYEGEREGEPSKTEGIIPVMTKDELVRLRVEENKIVEVIGDGEGATWWREHLAVDPARRNIAEYANGANAKADPLSKDLLDAEKALGFHWANGVSDHIGGVVGFADFTDPEHAMHKDYIYTKETEISPAEIKIIYPEDEDVTEEVIMVDGEYVDGLFD